jgi:hypothetical protein
VSKLLEVIMAGRQSAVTSRRAPGCALAFTILCAGAVGAAPGAALPQRLEGHFEFVGQAAERDALEQAIEATARQLSFVIRGMARSRLRAGNRIAPWVELEGQGDQIAVRFPGRPPMLARADGTPGRWKNEDGGAVNIEHRMEGETLVQVLRTNEGARTNRFSAGADGALRLAVEISSPRLPVPLKYTLSYRRAPATGTR